jgi:hypothetical protein
LYYFVTIFTLCMYLKNSKNWIKLHSKDGFLSYAYAGKNDQVPDFVFLAHVVDLTQSLHTAFVLRWQASLPHKFRPFLLLMLPGAFVTMLAMWAWSKTFLVSFYNIRGKLHQTWAVPRYGFQACSNQFSFIKLAIYLHFAFFMRSACTVCVQGIHVLLLPF